MSKAKNKHVAELTKPDMAKVQKKILNTAKCAAEQPTNVYPLNSLERLKAKYPKVAESLTERLAQFEA